MYIAVDDTDSKNGMCTTYLLTEIIKKSGLDVIGYPSLVRLNPAIRYKTRGNGALFVNLGRGTGKSKFLGKIGDDAIHGFESGEETLSQNEAMSLASEIVDDMAVVTDENTNPGIVVSQRRFSEDFYWKAVRTEVTIEEAETHISINGGSYRKFKNGRGIIGAAAALSWPHRKRTFEVLAYREQPTPVSHDLKMKFAERLDQVYLTFNNVDRRNRYPAIFPKERTPVLFGVRGFSDNSILKELPVLLAEYGIDTDRYLCFLTNQGTDDHILKQSSELQERQSYSLVGEILEKPLPIRGSHYFSEISVDGKRIGISAYEPTKEFRETFRELLPGDRIRVYGTYMEGGINLEKMEVLNLSKLYMKRNPECDECGKRMVNRGNGDYRCMSCKTRKRLPRYSEVKRSLKPGKYDVPVIARRHLSKPFELDYFKWEESKEGITE